MSTTGAPVGGRDGASSGPARSPLLTQVLGLVVDVADAYRGTPQAAVLDDVMARLHEPLRVAIAGKVKAGKSTLLNALVGDELAPTDAGECTRIVTWYRHGITYRVSLVPRQGTPRQVPFTRTSGAIDVSLDGLAADDVENLTVEWPAPALTRMTLIDTPGIGSISTDTSARSLAFLTPDDEQTTPSDAVVYLLRHLHAGDVAFLHAFHEEEYAQPSPVNCVAVLSRADEVSVGRLDAMDSAQRIARRYSGDPRLRRLVQRVTPVAGLLAQAGADLRELEFRRLRTLAEAGPAETEALLLSADRFVNGETAIPLAPPERQVLLERFGLFGVRLSVSCCGGVRRPPPRSSPPASSTTAGSPPCGRCSSPSSATGGTRSRPARRCWRSSACWRRRRSSGARRWPTGWSRSGPAPTSSPNCGCSTASASARSTSGPRRPKRSSASWGRPAGASAGGWA